MLPGKRDFYHCGIFTTAVKRGVAPRKQRVLAAISKLRSAFFTGYKKKNCTYHNIYVIVINQMRGLYEIYKSRDTRAKPEWQGFMNRVQTERWFITIL